MWLVEDRPTISSRRKHDAVGAVFLWWLASASWGDVCITSVGIDERPHSPPADLSKPWQISSVRGNLTFYFTCDADETGVRLRYKLEGHDADWRDIPGQLMVWLRLQNEKGLTLAGESARLPSLTPGWRGDARKAPLHPFQLQTVAPVNASKIKIYFLSGRGEDIGQSVYDDIRLRIEREDAPPFERTFEFTEGNALDQPLGVPAGWSREGSNPQLAQLVQRADTPPRTALFLNDDDPRRNGVWTRVLSEPVYSGDRVTLLGKTATCSGRGGSGSAVYFGLKPGNYWFRVLPVGPNGEPAGPEVSLPFAVMEPWYLSAELWLFLAALCSVAMAGVIRIRAQRRLQRQREEFERIQTLERERARIAHDLHDNVGAGLTEIAMQGDMALSGLEQGEYADAQRRLGRLCQFASELARDVDEIVWVVNPAHDTLPRFVNYLTQCAEQFLDAAGLRVRFELPSPMPEMALPGKIRHGLFWTVREALNNTVKHAQADMVRIAVRVNAASLCITVEDDGRGFDPAATGPDGTHEGLDNMRRRMREIGGRIEFSRRPGGGARLELSVTVEEQAGPTARPEESKPPVTGKGGAPS